MDLAWIDKAQHPMLDHKQIMLDSNLEKQLTQQVEVNKLFVIEWELV